MARIVKATVRLDIKEAERQAKQLGDTLAKAILKGVQQAKNADRDFGALIKAIRETGKTTFNLSLEQQKLETQVARTKTQLENLKKAIDATNAAQVKAADQSKLMAQRLKTEEERTKSVTKLNKRRDQQTEAARLKAIRTLQRIEEANKKAADAEKLFNTAKLKGALQSRITQAAISLLFESLRILKDELVSAFKVAIEWESAFAGVGKTVDGVFEKLQDGTFVLTDFGKALEVSLLALSRDIPIAVNELANIAESAGQLGVAAEDLETFTSTVAKLSVTTNLSSQVAATALAKLQTVLGITVEDTTRVASAIVDLGNNTATTEKQIVVFAQRLSGAAAVVNLTAADLLGIAAAFESIGAQSSASSTAVQKTFLAMQQASIEGGDALNLFAQIADATPDAFAELFQNDPGEAFTRFVEGLNRVDEAGGSATAVLKQLELGDSRLIRSFLAIAAAGSTLRDDIELSNKAFEDNNALNTEAALRFQTTESSLQELKNAWAEFKIEVAETGWISSISSGLKTLVLGLTDVHRTASQVENTLGELANLGVGGVSVSRDTLGRPQTVSENIPDNVGRARIDTGDLDDIKLKFAEVDRTELEALQFALEAVKRDTKETDEELNALAKNALLSGEPLTQTQIVRLRKEMELTGRELRILADEFLKTEGTVQGFFDAMDRAEVFDAIKDNISGISDEAANIFADGVISGELDLNLIDNDNLLEALGNTAKLKDQIKELTVARTNADDAFQAQRATQADSPQAQLGLQIRGVNELASSFDELTFKQVLASTKSVELAESISGLTLAEVGAAAQMRLFGKVIDDTNNSVTVAATSNNEYQDSLVETAISFLDTDDAGQQFIATALEEARALGLTDQELRGVIRSTGAFTEEQLITANATAQLAVATQRLSIEFVTGKISGEQFGNRLRNLAERSVGLAEETEELTSRTSELISEYIDADSALGKAADQILQIGIESGATSEQLLTMVAATGQLTVKEQEVIRATLEFEQAQDRLNNLVNLGVITVGQMASSLVGLAENLGLVENASASFTAELVKGLLDGDDALSKLNVRMIDAAVAAGATSDEIIALAEASGLLTNAQLETVASTVKLAEEERRLLALVDGVTFTFEQALVAVLAYADGLDIAANAGSTFAESTTDFLGSIRGTISGGGGGGRGESTAETPFREEFVNVIKQVSGRGDEANDSIEELIGSTEDWADALFDLSIEAGASIEQIIGLGIATGKLSQEQADQLLSVAAAQRGAEQIADQYVAGKISAEQAAGAVQLLSEQIQAGGRIDLSQFGITASDLTANAKALQSSAGGSSAALKDWRDDLEDSAQAAGANAQAILDLTRARGLYTEEQLKAGLVDQATSLATQQLGKDIADGLNTQFAVDQVQRLRESLNGLTAEELAFFIDFSIEAELDTTEAQQALDAFEEGGGVISIKASLEGVTPESIARTRAQIQEELNNAKALNNSAREAGIDTDDSVLQTTILADVTALKDAITAETTEKTYETTVDDADVTGVEEAIHNVTTDAEYTTMVDVDLDFNEIQSKLDAHDFTVNVESNFSFGTSSSSTSSPGANTGTPTGGGDSEFAEGGKVPNVTQFKQQNFKEGGKVSSPKYAEGGRVQGGSHAVGGVDIEAEGGEFFIKTNSVNAETEPLLDEINRNGSGALPKVAAMILDQLTAPSFDLPMDLGLNSTGDSGSLSSFVNNVTVPTPVSNDNSTNIDQSTANTNTNIINNYFGVGQNTSRVSGSLDVSGRF